MAPYNMSWGWILVVITTIVVYIDGNKDFFSIEVTDVDGTLVSLEQYRGKVVLVVNTATECGFTDSHFKGMVELQKDLGATNRFQVLAFPCTKFGSKEDKTIEEILKFAQNTYDINFPMFNIVNTDGPGAADVYSYIKEKSGSGADWNFWKYLISPEGDVLQYWGPWSSIEEALPVIKEAVAAATAGDQNTAGGATEEEVAAEQDDITNEDEEVTEVKEDPMEAGEPDRQDDSTKETKDTKENVLQEHSMKAENLDEQDDATEVPDSEEKVVQSKNSVKDSSDKKSAQENEPRPDTSKETLKVRSTQHLPTHPVHEDL